MVEFKLVIGNPKDGKCYQVVVTGDNADSLIGKKIGEKIRGELFDMTGYEFEITGGADHCGFPMRKDIYGPIRKKVLIVSGVGTKNRENGIRKRVTVCGNTVHDKITQVCLKVLKQGKKPLGSPKAKEGDAKEDKKAEPKKEAEKPKEEPKKEESEKEEKPKEEPKNEEVKEEKPKEVKKSGEKKEEKPKEEPKKEEVQKKEVKKEEVKEEVKPKEKETSKEEKKEETPKEEEKLKEDKK